MLRLLFQLYVLISVQLELNLKTCHKDIGSPFPYLLHFLIFFCLAFNLLLAVVLFYSY